VSNRTLCLKVGLRSPEALREIKAALAARKGIKWAAEELGIGRATLNRWGEEWPAVGTLLRRYVLDAKTVGSLGGKASRESSK
jgi:hypothetical protein